MDGKPMRPEWQRRVIPPDMSMLAALKKMDELAAKLLFIFEGERFAGLLSIGDIQRAIIANKGMDTSAGSLIRPDIVVAREGDDPESIREQMIALRAECMPVVAADGRLADVIFWDDVFPVDSAAERASRLDTPVVIMAGGMGSRLKPLTDVLPKPLLPVGTRTMVEEIIQRFARHDVPKFYISLHYKSQLVQFYIEQLALPFPIEFIVEPSLTGTAGSLALLKGRIAGTFFVTNCDVLIDEDYSAVLDYHRAAGNDLTLVAAVKIDRIPYGTVESGKDGQLVSLVEKPDHSYMVNTGLYVLEPAALDLLKADEFCDMTDFLERLRSAGMRIGVFPISDRRWLDIGEWPAYRKRLFADDPDE